ncbi:MAG: hypothetical protein JWM10_5400 [Myxococcaceae bacterium]|nr:hypothetical protein [Myxococcaceae bacterium]
MVGVLPELEDQSSLWVPGQKSPDRMDAMVWLLTHPMPDGPASASDDADTARGVALCDVSSVAPPGVLRGRLSAPRSARQPAGRSRTNT